MIGMNLYIAMGIVGISAIIMQHPILLICGIAAVCGYIERKGR